MARALAELPKGSRITDYISLGVIARSFPSDRVQSILEATATASIRQRDLPAHVVVYYVIAMALYMQFVVSRGVALPAGGYSVAAQPIGGVNGGWQIGDLAGAHAAGMGTAAPTA